MNIHTLFILLIAMAMACDIFGIVVQRGANLVRIDVRTALMSLLWAVFELLAILAGYVAGSWLLGLELTEHRSLFWVHVISGVILAAIGVRMFMLAFGKRIILEHRMEKVDFRTDILLALRLCVHGLLAGIVCGLLCFSLPQVIAAAFLISAASAVAGYISGRAWGVSPSGTAYAIGGGLMCALGLALQVLPFG